MASIGAELVQELLNRIDALKSGIETSGNEGRNKLQGIKVDEVCKEVRGTEGKFDATEWSGKCQVH